MTQLVRVPHVPHAPWFGPKWAAAVGFHLLNLNDVRKAPATQVACSCSRLALRSGSLRDPSPPHEGTLRPVAPVESYNFQMPWQVVQEVLAVFVPALLKKMMNAWIFEAWHFSRWIQWKIMEERQLLMHLRCRRLRRSGSSCSQRS